MGVAGSGKSTLGAALARHVGIPFIDGDDLHPQDNIAKMSSGVPLDDNDRQAWLRAIGEELAGASGGVVIAASALKRQYRDLMRAAVAAPVHFCHLAGPEDVLRPRMTDRPGHFMPASLLRSQFDALEELEPDEAGLVLDVRDPVEESVERAVHYLASRTL